MESVAEVRLKGKSIIGKQITELSDRNIGRIIYDMRILKSPRSETGIVLNTDSELVAKF